MRQYQSRLGLQGVYPASTRRGFTLIELLIVMVIILLLSGMLLGAVILVRRQVVKAQQIAELSQIDIALTNFKAKYGIYPPSRIRLRNWVVTSNGSYATTPSAPASEAYALNDLLDAHSIAYLRRIWPGIKLPIVQNKGDTVMIEQPTSNLIWFVDNSTTQEVSHTPLDLEGDQCLVFFLGGIAERRGATDFVLHGFAENPTNPTDIPNTTNPQTLARTQPYYNFDASRLYLRYDYSTLIDSGIRYAEQLNSSIPDFYTTGFQPGSTANNYLGRLPSYKVLNADTSAPMPVAYFSSYEGRGYRPDDINIPDPVNAGTGLDSIAFQLVWPTITIANTPVSLEPNPYSRNAAGPANRTGAGATNSIIQCYNPKTYQIILPGSDNLFGAGGSQLDYQQASWSENEDNLSNFSGGTTVGDFVTQQQK